MSIFLAGLSHHTAPIEIRERLADCGQDPAGTLGHLLKLDHVREAFFLSTCNRVEFLVVADGPTALEDLTDHLSRLSGLDQTEFERCIYLKEGREAIRHLFRVASSLDAMVVGEPQVLGQIKAAYHQASKARSLGVILNRLMHKTFSVAKRIRTETGISDHAVSISYAAVELAKKIFGQLDGMEILLIGAGEMAELAAENLKGQGVVSLTVANRTLERAVEVARSLGGRAASLAELDECLTRADIVISSVAAAEPIISREIMKKVLKGRRHKPIFLIDIAVPRNVEPTVGKLANVYLYDIDDLESVVARNLEERQQEAHRAERIVEEEAIKFSDWLATLAVVPTIKGLNDLLEDVRQTELKKTLAAQDFTAEQAEALELMTRAMMKKVLHNPAVFLKRTFKNPENRARYLDAAHRLFKLKATDGDKEN